MNSLERSLIEKAGYAHGWENVRESTTEAVLMESARHPALAIVTTPPDYPGARVVRFPQGPAIEELLRHLGTCHIGEGRFLATSERELGRILRRAAELAMALPNQAADHYAAEVARLDADPPSATESLALVKQRRGQEIFRQALLDYWGGACAVTGIAVPELLRASHAKPWAICDADADRLNVFNGLLLCAHLDALFDRGLMSFDPQGQALWSPTLPADVRPALGLPESLHLRWIAPPHLPFLEWHREHEFKPH